MQNWPQGYLEKIEAVFGDSFSNGELHLSFSFENEDEAKLLKKKLILMQKQLRQIRKDANYEMKTLRAKYGDKTKSVEAGFFSTLFGGAGRDRENKRRSIRGERDAELNKYQNVKSTIDGILIQLDSLKLQVEEKILKGSFDD